MLFQFFFSKIYDLFLLSWRSWLSSTSVPIKTKTRTVSRPNLLTCWLTNFHSTVIFFVKTFLRLRPYWELVKTCQDSWQFSEVLINILLHRLRNANTFIWLVLTRLNLDPNFFNQDWDQLVQNCWGDSYSQSWLGLLSFWPKLYIRPSKAVLATLDKEDQHVKIPNFYPKTRQCQDLHT